MSVHRRIGLLFGGRSVEHEVSLDSARSVFTAMQETDLVCVPLAVTDRGDWLNPEESTRILRGDLRRVVREARTQETALLAVAPGAGKLLELRADGASALELDAIFPMIHGWGGEDGRLQGLLELAGIPYVGAGVAGSAVAMDKAFARHLFAAAGLPLVPWVEFNRARYRADPRGVHDEILERLTLPVFVKPSNGGSSVGVTRVAAVEALAAAIVAALELDRRVVVEQGLDAREIECAVLGNDDARASILGEIVPSGEFYDYDAKYLDGSSQLKVPAPLDDATTARLRDLALSAYRALDIRGFARVDFLVDRCTGDFYLNEINTLPGFTSISMFPRLWEASGLAYPRLIAELVELALEST